MFQGIDLNSLTPRRKSESEREEFLASLNPFNTVKVTFTHGDITKTIPIRKSDCTIRRNIPYWRRRCGITPDISVEVRGYCHDGITYTHTLLVIILTKTDDGEVPKICDNISFEVVD